MTLGSQAYLDFGPADDNSFINLFRVSGDRLALQVCMQIKRLNTRIPRKRQNQMNLFKMIYLFILLKKEEIGMKLQCQNCETKVPLESSLVDIAASRAASNCLLCKLYTQYYACM